MNIFIAEDCNWDNYAKISKYISINYLGENTKVNHLYGKHLEKISNICNNNMLQLMRRVVIDENIETSIYNILKTVDMCILFHNFVEYNTITSFIIKACIKNDIDYIIISEHSNNYYINGELSSDKFKKSIKNILINKSSSCYNRTIIKTGDIIENPVIIFQPRSIIETINQIRKSYEMIETDKKNKSIVIITEQGEERYSGNRQIRYIEYMNNHKKWLKEVIPRS